MGPWVACTSQIYATQVHSLGYSTKAQTQLGLWKIFHFKTFLHVSTRILENFNYDNALTYMILSLALQLYIVLSLLILKIIDDIFILCHQFSDSHKLPSYCHTVFGIISFFYLIESLTVSYRASVLKNLLQVSLLTPCFWKIFTEHVNLVYNYFLSAFWWYHSSIIWFSYLLLRSQLYILSLNKWYSMLFFLTDFKIPFCMGEVVFLQFHSPMSNFTFMLNFFFYFACFLT